MKLFKFLFLLVLGLSITLTSCDKDNVDDIDKIEEIIPTIENNIISKLVVVNNEGLQLDCITVLYTFQMVTVNDNIVDITSDEDFEAALFDSVDFVVDFVYPLDVLDSDGVEVEVADIEALGELFAACIPDGGWGEDLFPAFLINLESSCFEFVYPIDLIDMDSVVITTNNELEFIDAIAGNDILFFVFPFDMENDSLGVVTVNDAYELFDYLASCDIVGGPCDSLDFGGTIACYEIQFPVDFEMFDGSIETANDLDELLALYFNGEVLDFAYPVTLLNLETDVLITVNDADELNEAILECSGYGFVDPIGQFLIGPMTFCYVPKFPLTGVDADGQAITINDQDELEEAVFDEVILDLPLTVITVLDDVEHVINSFEDLMLLMEGC